MFKWLFIIGFIFAFILLPQVRYTCFHLPLVFYNFVIDTYKYFKYKKYNEYRGYGRMQIYVADEKQPFGSGKTLSITIQEGAIQNNNNPTFTNNNNITVEGDTINNDVNNYVGNNTSSETNKNFIEKFLGFFQLLENNSFLGVWGKVFGWLPPGVSSVITTALGIGACVGLFKFFRK